MIQEKDDGNNETQSLHVNTIIDEFCIDFDQRQIEERTEILLKGFSNHKNAELIASFM
jgi:hypothetical protein